MNARSHRGHPPVIGMVWLLLMAATLASTWGASDRRIPASIAAVATLLIAAFKARLIVLYFMELKTAPVLLRLYFELWIVVVAGAILLIYALPPNIG
jgi:caa(3)-type oxidase subunit IV